MELLDYDREKDTVTIKMDRGDLWILFNMVGSFSQEFDALDETIHGLSREEVEDVAAKIRLAYRQAFGLSPTMGK